MMPDLCGLPVFCLLVLAPVIAAFLLLYRNRKRRFLKREVLSPDEWFRRYFPSITATRPILAELLEELGKEIGTEWTRFRPDDTFSRTFLFKRGSLGHHDELDGFWCAQGEWVTRHGIDPKALVEPVVDRLADYVAKMNHLVEVYCPPLRKTNHEAGKGPYG